MEDLEERGVYHLPVPLYLQVETASKHDLTALKSLLESLQNAIIALDKAYCDEELKENLEKNNNVQLFTPEKIKKNESLEEKQQSQASRKVLNTAVAKVGQSFCVDAKEN